MTQYPVTGSSTTRRNPLATLGISLRDVAFWLVGMIIAFGVCLAWHLFLIGPSQVTNKYVLTALLLVLVVVWTALALVLDRHVLTGPAPRSRRVGAVLVRLGTAMLLFGSAIAPVGLYYHNIPIYSVPVGFAYFTLGFIGIFVAGFGGNMLAPPKQ